MIKIVLTPAELVSLLNPTTPDLSSRIGRMTRVWTDNGTKVTGRFFYLKFRDSRPTIDELISVAYARLVNFAVPRSRINEAKQAIALNPDAMDAYVTLVQEARDLFIRTKQETARSGELGEMLLYMLLEWVLQAPIVACKMYLKTSQQMPVHGTDGIHMGHEGENLIMYWGESKLHATLPSALDDIVSSIQSSLQDNSKRDNEIRIVKQNLNLDGMQKEGLEALKRYFNPYAVESNKCLDCYACLAGFDYEAYESVSLLPHETCEAEFCKIYEAKMDSACDLIMRKLVSSNLTQFRFTYFLLPFPSVEAARKLFQKELGGI